MKSIKLDFNESELSELYHTACRSFVKEQPERFAVVGEPFDFKAVIIDIHANKVAGSLFFFDSFLEAKVFQAAYFALNRIAPCYILLDEADGEFCAWTNDDFDKHEINQSLVSLAGHEDAIAAYIEEFGEQAE